MTLAEAHSQEFDPKLATPLTKSKPRFLVQQAYEQFESGGLPIPLFSRESQSIKMFFTNWLDTSIFRDAARAYGSGYNPDIALSILRQMGSVMKEGELPTLKHFKEDSRKLRRYFQALEDIFLLQKLYPHESSVGNEVWLPSDSGIAAAIMGTIVGDGPTLSLARIFVIKEVRALTEYSGNRFPLLYFKTARSQPVDFVWNSIPIKISISKKSQFAYDERSLQAAMKAVKSKQGIICCSYDDEEFNKEGVSRVPWTHWS
jgi:predicted AAA+ superfamily ATPase